MLNALLVLGALLAVRESPVGGEWEPRGSESPAGSEWEPCCSEREPCLVVRALLVMKGNPVGSEGEPCW